MDNQLCEFLCEQWTDLNENLDQYPCEVDVELFKKVFKETYDFVRYTKEEMWVDEDTSDLTPIFVENYLHLVSLVSQFKILAEENLKHNPTTVAKYIVRDFLEDYFLSTSRKDFADSMSVYGFSTSYKIDGSNFDNLVKEMPQD